MLPDHFFLTRTLVRVKKKEYGNARLNYMQMMAINHVYSYNDRV